MPKFLNIWVFVVLLCFAFVMVCGLIMLPVWLLITEHWILGIVFGFLEFTGAVSLGIYGTEHDQN